MGVGTLGRKKKSMADRNRKSVAITIKGDELWREWVEAGARKLHMPVSVLVDMGITRLFKELGYDVPPPDRLPRTEDPAPPEEPKPKKGGAKK
jgi:hypothetical protein